jgi:hypothetical protein
LLVSTHGTYAATRLLTSQLHEEFHVAGESRVGGICGSRKDPSVPTVVDDEELSVQTMEAVVLRKIRPSRSFPELELLVFGLRLGCRT